MNNNQAVKNSKAMAKTQVQSKNEPYTPIFKTLALADPHIIKDVTGVSVPSEDAVEEAKKWVDFNEK